MPPFDTGQVYDDAIASFTGEDSDAPVNGLPPSAEEKLQFRIRWANSPEKRYSADALVEKRYSWRGYDQSCGSAVEINRVTLIASDLDHVVVGTITIGFDRQTGLFADDMYREQLDALRREGKKLCEYNRLAVEPHPHSKRVLAKLFHIAYLYPHEIFGCTDGVLEINPRHVRFYEKMLGFTQIGPERICPRVNAPSVLMKTNFSYMSDQVQRVGGQTRGAKGDRTLYPYFFSPEECVQIMGRLRQERAL
jgi:hypothetical protein